MQKDTSINSDSMVSNIYPLNELIDFIVPQIHEIAAAQPEHLAELIENSHILLTKLFSKILSSKNNTEVILRLTHGIAISYGMSPETREAFTAKVLELTKKCNTQEDTTKEIQPQLVNLKAFIEQRYQNYANYQPKILQQRVAAKRKQVAQYIETNRDKFLDPNKISNLPRDTKYIMSDGFYCLSIIVGSDVYELPFCTRKHETSWLATTGWLPPQPLVDAIMQGDKVGFRVYMNSPYLSHSYSITAKEWQEIQNNSAKSYLPHVWAGNTKVYHVGNLNVVDTADGRSIVVDSHSGAKDVESIQVHLGTIAKQGEIMWQEQDVTKAFWHRLSLMYKAFRSYYSRSYEKKNANVSKYSPASKEHAVITLPEFLSDEKLSLDELKIEYRESVSALNVGVTEEEYDTFSSTPIIATLAQLTGAEVQMLPASSRRFHYSLSHRILKSNMTTFTFDGSQQVCEKDDPRDIVLFPGPPGSKRKTYKWVPANELFFHKLCFTGSHFTNIYLPRSEDQNDKEHTHCLSSENLNSYEHECQLGKQGRFTTLATLTSHYCLTFEVRKSLDEAIVILTDPEAEIIDPTNVLIIGNRIYLTGSVHTDALLLKTKTLRSTDDTKPLSTDKVNQTLFTHSDVYNQMPTKVLQNELISSLARLLPESLSRSLQVIKIKGKEKGKDFYFFAVKRIDNNDQATLFMQQLIMRQALELLESLLTWYGIQCFYTSPHAENTLEAHDRPPIHFHDEQWFFGLSIDKEYLLNAVRALNDPANQRILSYVYRIFEVMCNTPKNPKPQPTVDLAVTKSVSALVPLCETQRLQYKVRTNALTELIKIATTDDLPGLLEWVYKKVTITNMDYILTLAAEHGSAGVVSLILKKYSYKLQKYKTKNLALRNAAEKGDWPTIEALLQHDARLKHSDHGNTLLGRLVCNGHTRLFEQLVEQNIPYFDNEKDRSHELDDALAEACCFRWSSEAAIHIVKLLDKAGASIKCPATSKYRRTLLGNCIYHHHFNVASYLLKKGVDINQHDEDGNTVLINTTKSFVKSLKAYAETDHPHHKQYTKNNLEELKFLVQQKGIKINTTDQKGKTALGLIQKLKDKLDEKSEQYKQYETAMALCKEARDLLKALLPSSNTDAAQQTGSPLHNNEKQDAGNDSETNHEPAEPGDIELEIFESENPSPNN